MTFKNSIRRFCLFVTTKTQSVIFLITNTRLANNVQPSHPFNFVVESRAGEIGKEDNTRPYQFITLFALRFFFLKKSITGSIESQRTAYRDIRRLCRSFVCFRSDAQPRRLLFLGSLRTNTTFTYKNSNSFYNTVRLVIYRRALFFFYFILSLIGRPYDVIT